MQELTLVLTRLNGMTTKEEVYEAVMRELGNGHSVALKAVESMRMTYGGMQTTLLKLLGKQTMRVNWSDERVQEVMKPTKCFKCW